MNYRASQFLLPTSLLLALAVSACGKSEDDDTGAASEASTGTATTATTTAPGTTGADSSGGPLTTTEPVTTTTPTTGETGEPATSTGPDETTDAPAEGCDGYCATIETNCAGQFAQYGTPQMCQGACAAFAPGTPGATDGNSLACRTYHAGAAAMADDVHCGHAGPGGDTACGSNCEGFCAIADKYCPDAWPDNDACIVACTGFSATEIYDASDVAGDTFACRLYHATAATVDPAVHCAHIKGDSPVCK